MKIIKLNGEFGWDITSESIMSQLEKANGDDLEVHLASPGGSVFQGIKVFNDFRDYKRKYPKSENMLIVKGLAASMSSYFMMNPAFSIVAVEDNASYMMHNPWGGMVGDYREAENFYKMMEGLTDLMSEAYSKKLKKPKAEIRKMLDDETWSFGENIVKEGFADEVIKTDMITNEDSAKSLAKMQLKELERKIKSEETDINNYLEIAAMLKPQENNLENRTHFNISGFQIPINHEAQNPADVAGNNITEVKSMLTLEKFLDENPAARIEIENMFKAKLKEEYKAGFDAGKEEVQNKFKAVSNYIAPDSAYGTTIKTTAIDVLKGEISLEAFNTVVRAYDAMKEANASTAAIAETAALGETPGEHLPQPSGDGVIKNEIDLQAIINQAKIEKGMEVT